MAMSRLTRLSGGRALLARRTAAPWCRSGVTGRAHGARSRGASAGVVSVTSAPRTQ